MKTCESSPYWKDEYRNFEVAEGHPRVMVRPEDLPALREKAKTTHQKEYESLVALYDQVSKNPIKGEGTYELWRLSFLYLLSEDPAHAAAAKPYIEHILKMEVSGQYFTGARRLKALVGAYDWMHDALDPELRKRLGEACLAYSVALYKTREIEPGSYFLGHAINQMPFVMMAAIAIHSEIDGADCIIADLLCRTDLQFAAYKAFLEKDSFQQSMSYTCTYVGEFPYLIETIDKGLGRNLTEEYRWMANVVPWWTYGFRDDTTFIRFGDYFGSHRVLRNAAYWRPLAFIASRYNDGRAQAFANRFSIGADEPDKFLFEDRPGVAAVEPHDLPRTRLFELMGLAVARGDFNTQPGEGGTIAAFKCTPIYLHNHGHRDANSFTIYHKGELAIDSGAYDSYETPHWYNYYVRTIAHNTLVVHDPEEKFVSRRKTYSNDGGQRFINSPDFQPRTIEQALSKDFVDGKMAAYQDGDGWSYACGDASNTYNPQKLKKFLRHVVFVLDWPHKSAVSMVVLDEVELAKSGLTPRILLHTVNEPNVSGNRIRTWNRGGRLVADVLHPQQPKIELIGGPGKEFWVDGQNYPLNEKMGRDYHPGAWRAEVSSQSSTMQQQFLTFLTPSDVEVPEMPPATVEQTDDGFIVKQAGLTVALLKREPSRSITGERVIKIKLYVEE